MKSQISNLKCTALAFAALSLSAGVGLWFGHKTGVVALVVTPRQYVSVMPGATQAFAAVAWWGDGSHTDMTAAVTWQCSPAIGAMAANALSATTAQPVFGWVEGSFSGLATRVFVKVTPDGIWNPDGDADGDGISDAAELVSNDIPDKVTFLNVRCRVH